jgi:hypothetical protein
VSAEMKTNFSILQYNLEQTAKHSHFETSFDCSLHYKNVNLFSVDIGKFYKVMEPCEFNFFFFFA